MEAEAESNKNAAEILREFMEQGVAIQDQNGKISIPSASKIKPPTKWELLLVDEPLLMDERELMKKDSVKNSTNDV